MVKLYLNSKKIIDLYLTNKTSREIAKIFKCNKSPILKILKKNDISREKEQEPNHQEVINLYNEHQSIRQVSKILNKSRTRLTKILKLHNIKFIDPLKGKNWEDRFGKEKAKEIKEKSKKSHKGQVAWNKGLTKETSEIIRKAIEKYKITVKEDFRTGKRVSPMLGKKLSPETIAKIKAKLKNRKRDPCPEKLKEKLSKIHKERWINLSIEEKEKQIKRTIRTSHIRPTSYEQKISNLCINYNLPFVYSGNGTFLVGRKNPDFKHKTLPIVIEVFNNFYKIKMYGSIENYIKIRSEHFKRYGYKVIFIPQEEITSKDWKEKCLDKIECVINNQEN